MGTNYKQGIPRDEFFITSKLGRNLPGYDNARSEFEKTLKPLDTDYLDLYLLHWPGADYGMPGFEYWKRLDVEGWKALEDLQREGIIRSIGVSNFLPHHLENLLDHSDVTGNFDCICRKIFYMTISGPLMPVMNCSCRRRRLESCRR